jgi:hypothetical protein
MKRTRWANGKLWLMIAAVGLSLAVFSTGARADDAPNAEPDHHHSTPEPSWYLMLAAGAMIPAGFYLMKRKTAAG